MRLLGESSGSRGIQGLPSILTARARKARVRARKGAGVGGQAGEPLPRSLKRGAKKVSLAGQSAGGEMGGPGPL